jgi:hypothetical protein
MSVARTLAYVASRGISSAGTSKLPMNPALASANIAATPVVSAQDPTRTIVLQRIKVQKSRRPRDVESHLLSSKPHGRFRNPPTAA